MSEAVAGRFSVGKGVLALLALGLLLALLDLRQELAPAQWWQALWTPDRDNLDQLLMHYSWLPRLFVALLCGAALGLAGLLMQQVLRNPLASPTTLGVANGAQLALALATLYAPGLLVIREWVALVGGGLSMLLVYALARRRGMSPLSLILAGMVLSLYLGALNVMLMMLQPQGLTSLFIWSAGSLSQNSWDSVLFLLPRLLLVAVLVAWLIRPLSLLELEETGARSLGVSLDRVRLGGLALAVFLTACVVSVVGLIGFIGLAAPAICRLMGARTLRQRLIWTPLLGAALLWLADLGIQQLSGQLDDMLPTGAVTALLGAPLLLWLLPRMRMGGGRPQLNSAMVLSTPARPLKLLWIGGLLLALIALALWFGRGAEGWQWILDPQVVQWRTPRVLAAAGAGLMLALAGTLLQRLTGNPLASPEIMGISAGAAMALMAMVFLWPGAPLVARLVLGCLGALVTLLIIMGFARRQSFSPERLLLVGIAISSLFDAVQMLVLSMNDPRGQSLLGWLAGSTYHVQLPTSIMALVIAAVLLLLCLPLGRWLTLLPLGEDTPRSLGVPLARARLSIMLLAALLTAAATLLVGPLSFIGLMAPHLARLLGFNQARTQLLAAGLLGAGVMVAADWLGRNLLFPTQLPAGLLAALIGGAYLIWGLSRRPR
ncbi:Fe(3+)-hydroxamate ABC transporter permease FhuB [Halopseudomonas pelagia]|uniref:Fe(3+)-hydroxamate ABC transporter permease FhuB n=1 Tax=Halopseudomonas pelagia TaxID=553151 RepID=A0AA91Z746_9GAMM|nr:Fe(3+)-hydroxamate ABC transporter permease FhuB [Halopseudomonas pelagia]PCD00532.1 Fe(3+)-hydroxamate ABC transporter permease FhuB [Halopseudomonas pelagia]QFY55235.1 Fe(3+)-hydroxamate ABC transporter permease FhuB [Halopseudomonas pelagia]